VLTEELWQRLPASLVDRIVACEGVLVDEPVTAENMDQVVAQVAELQGALDEVRRRLPEIERELEALPRRLPDDLSQTRLEPQGRYGNLSDSSRWELAAKPDQPTWEVPHAWVRFYVDQLDPSASGTLERYTYQRENVTYTIQYGRLRFEAASTPVDLETAAGRLTFTVPVRSSTPDLFLRSETWTDSLAVRFFGRRDAKLGHLAFDDRFLVDAEQEVAEKLLDKKARKAILAICRFDEPILNIENGVCRLRFRSDGTKPAFDAAIELLQRIHRTQFDVTLVRER
jgi:hypothetical protein